MGNPAAPETQDGEAAHWLPLPADKWVARVEPPYRSAAAPGIWEAGGAPALVENKLPPLVNPAKPGEKPRTRPTFLN